MACTSCSALSDIVFWGPGCRDRGNTRQQCTTYQQPNASTSNGTSHRLLSSGRKMRCLTLSRQHILSYKPIPAVKASKGGGRAAAEVWLPPFRRKGS